MSSCRPGLEQGAWRTCRVSRNGMVYALWILDGPRARGSWRKHSNTNKFRKCPLCLRGEMLVSMRHVRHACMARVSHECRIDTSLGWRTTTRLIQCYIQG